MSTEHITIKLDVKPRTPAGWLTKGKAVSTAANAATATFSSLSSLLTQLTADVTALDKAQSAAANKGKVETTARNAACTNLKKSLRAFVAGVQGLCDAAPDAAHAMSIAAAASLDAKELTLPHKADFAGKAVGAGAVHLFAKVPTKTGRRVFYDWQMSTDGGKTWVSLPSTNDANTLVQNLTSSTTVSFRHRTTVKNVASDWSQTIVILVH